MLSPRGLKNVEELSVPWRFSLTQTYDPEENPTGLISFGMAENVYVSHRQEFRTKADLQSETNEGRDGQIHQRKGTYTYTKLR
jgi:hypothetical protein